MRYQLPEKEIDTKYGRLIIRPYMSSKISQELIPYRDVEPREFALLFLEKIIILPKITLEDLHNWDDAAVAYVIRLWIEEQKQDTWKIPEKKPFFEVFQICYREYLSAQIQESQKIISDVIAPFQKQLQELRSLYAQQARRVTSITQDVNSMLRAFADNVQNLRQSYINYLAQTESLFDRLSDHLATYERFIAHSRAAKTIEEEDFPFLLHYLFASDMQYFVGIDKVDTQVRSAAVTNRMLGLTRQNEFMEEIKDLFHNSVAIKKRWHILEKALEAHQNRQYVLSIPTLLAQVEGIFTDTLLLKKIVMRHKGKLVVRDIDGSIKLGSDGKPIKLRGLGQIVNGAEFRNEPALQSFADFFMPYLVLERNDILHGRSINYDKAKLSVQLVLIIYGLAIELYKFEKDI